MLNNRLTAIAHFFRSKGGGVEPVRPLKVIDFENDDDLKAHCRVFGADFEEMKSIIGRPGRDIDQLVTTQSLLNPEARESTACLVGDYTEADRFLWVAVCMGFPSMVMMALNNGAEVSRTYECRTSTGAVREVDLLFLAFLKSNEPQLAVHRSTLLENGLGCCDAARIWNVRVCDTFNREEMDGSAVANMLVRAGANPYREIMGMRPPLIVHGLPMPSAFMIALWKAVDYLPHLGLLHRERVLNLSLPVVVPSSARARL